MMIHRKSVLLALCLSWWSCGSRAEDIGEGSGFTHDDTWLLTTQETLLNLYGSAKGLSWTVSTNWLQSSTNFCSWHGITCYGNETTVEIRRVGRVKTIDLSNNHLVGSIPTDLWSLPFIQTINLRDNPDLSIDFTNIDQAQYLKGLNIANTLVSSLQGIGKLSNNLQTLQVASLGLGGPLPDELFNLTNLQGFYANYNHFNGTLSTELASLTQLTDLYLYYNDFTGQIPTEIGLLTSLKVMTLAQNAFSGTLPTEMNLLTNLEILAVHRILDQEKGFGITGGLPSFSQLQSINQIYLENQGLKGPIPPDFLANAEPQDVIQVNLMNNQLTGAVPTQLTQLSRLELQLAGNKITDVAATICSNINGWFGGSLQDLPRICDGFLCPTQTYAPEGRATIDAPCAPCAANKRYYGATTCTSATTSTGDSVSERQILIELYNRMGGKNWQNSNHWLDLTVDVCDWYGIQCFNHSVTGILLKNNGLSNSPPTELFQLSNLRNLNFDGNSVDFSFSGISQVTNLESLDLSQTDLTSLLDIQELSSTTIRQLLLPSNLLQGTIPQALFTLSTLEELDISDNRFQRLLPSQVKQLTLLSSLRCFGNSLTGQIPSTIGSLTALTELSCSENQFSGTLPVQLDQLTNLQTLSFRQNSTEAAIGGPLLSFANLAQLTDLHLDSNKLSGPLPTSFLQNTRHGGDRVEVILGDNMLTGSIPASWGNWLDRLFIDLTGNNITGIDSTLCSKQGWMDGQVKSFQCNAILCPANTYNEVGRQADASSTCISCPSSDTSSYLGSKNCGEANLTSGDEFDLLENFYYSVGGNSWNNNTGWVTDADVCQTWSGITCDGNGHVVKISLNGNGLQGTVASSLFRLPYLSELDLGNNQISFSFNGIAKASQLGTLKLEGVGLNSLSGIGQATNLVTLQLTDNDLTSLPSELFRLSNLQSLYLNYNQITGRIPSGISLMTSLEELFLDQNRFTGQIPAAVGVLTNLKTLALDGNDIGGTLPPEINTMASLEVLSIQRDVEANASQGMIQPDPTGSSVTGIQGPLLSFNSLKFIKSLFLAGNSLTGTIPFAFFDGKVNKTEEIEVDLTSNQLTGQIPASLTQFAQLNLYVADNQITSIAEGLCTKTLWLNGEVGSLGSCNAILCPNNTYSVLGRAEQTTDTKCNPCPSGTHAEFYGSTQCFNSSEQQIFTEREVLIELYQATGGIDWANNENWLDPTESICLWYGVYCLDPNQESVAGIVLEQNGLAGIVPSSIYMLSNLQELNFAGNDIVMDFRGIASLPSLGFLNLDNTGISSLAGLEQSKVVVLHVGGNSFDGKFPSEILSLSSLESLFMSGNNFGGQLPSQIGSLKDLAFLECGRCGLTGNLPGWIGSLLNLQYLSLYQNFLTGILSTNIMQLTSLKHLDLSLQEFAGSLPDFAEMSQLTELILSGNNLNGTISSSFLAGVKNISDLVTVNLENNLLSGSLPVELSRFINLDLYVSDNRISSIPSVLCNTSWNEGDVRKYGCDGILCGKGYFNSYGRATGNHPCSVCNSSTWLGTSFCGETLKNESDVLILLFKETNGFGWADSNGWFEDLDFCGWAGITCKGGNIHGINLGNNNLAGSIGGSIWQLEYLEELNLRENNVLISFEGIEKASSLRVLQLSETNVSSLTGIGRAVSLVELYLDSNEIKGPLPNELFNLTALEKLYLNNNDLSGTLPTLIGNLSSLQELYVFQNNLSGEIPSEIATLNMARVLSIGENQFNGTIPLQLNAMPNLEILSLQGRAGQPPGQTTTMFGVASTGSALQPLLPFTDVPKLRELYLGSLNLIGTIPSEFLFNSNATQAIVVDLTSNLLSGSIPTDLTRFRDLNLYLADNHISSIPPSICAKSDWLGGNLTLNCDALLCPPGTYNVFGRQVGSSAPCEVCTFGTAHYYGTMDCGLADGPYATTTELLAYVFHATNGSLWTSNRYWNTDTAVCKWFGVHCVNGEVVELNLAANNLKGTIPSAIYYLPSLQILNVAGNEVDISFDLIETAQNLKELYLNSTSVSHLDGVGKAGSLVKLFAGSSKLAGNIIPDEFYQLTQLKEVDLSDNSLIGTLSTLLGNLSNLESLQCQNNNLSGEIPSEVGMLTLLKILDLSENEIEGLLSSSLNGLRSLQSFRMDSYTRNIAGITGPLLSFSDASSLTEISFGSNSLTGTLPVDLLAGVQDVSQHIKINLQSNSIGGK
jgi:Leucine-rich repeat (LRR) protein